jgi:L-asparaginase
MRRADQDAPDGPGNLRDAIVVAASDSARGAGALVVFAGRIIAAGRAWKARRVDLEAFVDLGDELGRVVDGRIEPSARLATIRRRAQPLAGRLDSHVELVKVAPGMSDWPFRALPEDTRGLVVEALPGVGGIPPGMIEGLAAVARRMPVVIASRAPYGQLPEAATGGTGEPLRDVGLLSAGPLSAEQAYLLLMAVLGETEPSDVATRFASAAGNATSS